MLISILFVTLDWAKTVEKVTFKGIPPVYRKSYKRLEDQTRRGNLIGGCDNINLLSRDKDEGLFPLRGGDYRFYEAL